jgi:hypothetical protein
MRNDELSTAEIVALAERMDDAQRRDLIGRIAMIGDDQSLRIAAWLIGVTLSADAKTRSTLH